LFNFIKEHRVFAEENTMSTRVPYRVIGVEIKDDGIFFKYDTGRSF
jgi:hypothetical protein